MSGKHLLDNEPRCSNGSTKGKVESFGSKANDKSGKDHGLFHSCNQRGLKAHAPHTHENGSTLVGVSKEWRQWRRCGAPFQGLYLWTRGQDEEVRISSESYRLASLASLCSMVCGESIDWKTRPIVELWG